MAGNTPNLGLYKGTPGSTTETFNIDTMLNQNWDKLDAGVQKEIHKGTTAPLSPADNDLWLDTSVTPNILKRYTAATTSWVKVTPTTASEITQDVNNRFVTDAEKADWNVKETPAGAQAKVDTGISNHEAKTDPHPQYAKDTDLSAHTTRTDNPHGVTPAQIGAVATSTYTASDVLTKIKTVDGSGSGLDADLLDGQHGSYYLPTSAYTASDVLTKIKTVDGAGSGLDADTVRGQEVNFDKINNDYLSVESSINWKFPVTNLTLQTSVGTSADIYVMSADGSFYKFNTVNKTWTQLATQSGASTGTTMGRMWWDGNNYIYGVVNTDTTIYIYRYSISSNSWATLGTKAYTLQTNFNPALIGDSNYLYFITKNSTIHYFFRSTLAGTISEPVSWDSGSGGMIDDFSIYQDSTYVYFLAGFTDKRKIVKFPKNLSSPSIVSNNSLNGFIYTMPTQNGKGISTTVSTTSTYNGIVLEGLDIIKIFNTPLSIGSGTILSNGEVWYFNNYFGAMTYLPEFSV